MSTSGMSARLTEALADRYTVIRELGAGGMATVYLAEDVRHSRHVALKVLRPELAAVIGADRFLKEIETTAHLQHPHILPLFDSGTVEGTVFYVMPYVDGESLRDRLTRETQLPLEEAVRITREVAAALDYAHRKGIIHRDIKPENILLHDGQALVADFGVALAASRTGGSRMTETGMSLGTPHYMSPEQAMGERALDARSDVYALGCMLYEMLTGEPPFTGPTAQAIVAKVMTEKPVPPTRHRDTIPGEVEDAILTAIAKLPADRHASAAAFAEALRMGAPGDARRRVRADESPTRRRPIATIAMVGVAAVALLATGWTLGQTGRERSNNQSLPPTRLALLAPGLGGSGGGALYRQFSLTPDGGSVIYYTASPGSGGGMLARQRLDSESMEIVQGTAVIFGPEISPDGQWLAARNHGGDLVLSSLESGVASFRLVDRGQSFFAWHPDGSLWYMLPPYRTMMRLLPRQDSATVMFPDLSRSLWLQQIIDDGRLALATNTPNGSASGPLISIDLRDGKLTTLISTPVVSARYTVGWLLYSVPDGTLQAREFDPRTRRIGDTVLPIATGVSVSGSGESQLSVASNGTVAYVPEEPRSLVRVDRSGAESRVTEAQHLYHMPRFSPDGRTLSVDFVTQEGRDVWLLDLQQRTMSRATFEGDGHDASWTPDGKQITFVSSRSGAFSLLNTTPGLGAAADTVIANDTLNFTGDWLPDGSGLVTVAQGTLPGSADDIVIVHGAGRGPIEPLVATRFNENYPALAPDGRWVAYVSDQSGTREVYIRSTAGDAWQVQVSQGGGDEPMWTRDGRELFYRGAVTRDPIMIVAAIRTDPTTGMPEVANRTTLFSASDYLPSTPHSNYAVTPDGRGIIAVKRNPSSRIMIIQNLPALLERIRSGAPPR